MREDLAGEVRMGVASTENANLVAGYIRKLLSPSLPLICETGYWILDTGFLISAI